MENQKIDPSKLDLSQLMSTMKNLSDGLNKAVGGNNSTTVFDNITIEKTYPVTVSGKKGTVTVTKDKTITMKFEGITSDEIVNMIKKLHD